MPHIDTTNRTDQKLFQVVGASEEVSSQDQTSAKEFSQILEQIAGHVATLNARDRVTAAAIESMDTARLAPRQNTQVKNAGSAVVTSAEKSEESSSAEKPVQSSKDSTVQAVDSQDEKKTDNKDSDEKESEEKDKEVSTNSDATSTVAQQVAAADIAKKAEVKTEKPETEAHAAQPSDSPFAKAAATQEPAQTGQSNGLAKDAEKPAKQAENSAKEPIAEAAKTSPTSEASAETSSAEVSSELSVASTKQSAGPLSAPSTLNASGSNAFAQNSLVIQSAERLLQSVAIQVLKVGERAGVAVDRDSLVSTLAVKPMLDSAVGKVGEAKSVMNSGSSQNFSNFDGSQLKQSDSANRSDSAQSKATRSTSRVLSDAMTERVENALKEAAKAKDGSTISLRLDPPQLGSVKVDVSLRDGTLHARIVPESQQVGQYLRERAPELLQNLKKLGLDVATISVAVGGDSFNQAESSLAGGGSQGQNGSLEQRLSSEVSYVGGEQEVGVKQGLAVTSTIDHWVA